MLKFIFKDRQAKYTCACCDYQTLLSNGVGEICPVCFWEEGYDNNDDLFRFSSTNHMILYQAQENYKIHGCSNNKFLKHCRKPFNNEKKDLNWYSIQDIIENKYSITQLVKEIAKYCELLKKTDSVIIYRNFKSLREIDIAQNHKELELDFLESCESAQFDKYKCELKLKSLLIALSKKDSEKLIKLFEKYYKNGLYYYIAWSIMLIVLTNAKQYKFGENITNILLDIENNNCYGLASLETALKQYWLMKH